ncbi:MAG: hypothetical protein ACPLRA_02900 [Candidatus Saccharicenans sp.]
MPESEKDERVKPKRLVVLFLLPVLSVCLLSPSQGQQKRLEFLVGYRTITSSQIAEILTNVLVITITI